MAKAAECRQRKVEQEEAAGTSVVASDRDFLTIAGLCAPASLFRKSAAHLQMPFSELAQGQTGAQGRPMMNYAAEPD